MLSGAEAQKRTLGAIMAASWELVVAAMPAQPAAAVEIFETEMSRNAVLDGQLQTSMLDLKDTNEDEVGIGIGMGMGIGIEIGGSYGSMSSRKSEGPSRKLLSWFNCTP